MTVTIREHERIGAVYINPLKKTKPGIARLCHEIDLNPNQYFVPLGAKLTQLSEVQLVVASNAPMYVV